MALMDAASFAGGVACWAFIKVEEDRPAPSGPGSGSGSAKGWREQTSVGFVFLARTPALRQLTVALTLGLFVMGLFETLGMAIATVGLHHPPTWTGVIVTAMGVTGIVGGMSAGAALRRFGPGRLTALGLGICSVCLLYTSDAADE